MKKIMKKSMRKVLSLAIVVMMAISLLPMPASAAMAATPIGSGTDTDPYVIEAGDGSVAYGITIEASGRAFVQLADDVTSATINGIASTMGEYSVGLNYVNLYSSTDGVLEYALEGRNMFMVVNAAEETNYVILSATASGQSVDTTGTMDDPEKINLVANMWGGVGADVSQELEADNSGYYYQWTATAAGQVTFQWPYAVDSEENSIGWMYSFSNMTTGKYGDIHWSDDEVVVSYETLDVAEGDVVQLFVSTYDPENMWVAPAGTISGSLSFAAVGSFDIPEEITVGKQSATLEAGSNGYFYIWTATEAGTATVTMDDTNENGWQYCVDNITSYDYGDPHMHDDDPVVSSQDITVSAGDEIQIMVNTYDPENQWNAPVGTVNWTLSFVAGDIAGDDTTGDDTTGDDADGDEDPVLGSVENPYQLSVDSMGFSVYVQPGQSVYVQTSDANGTVEVGYATAGTWFIQYGMLTQVYPETESGDYTATLCLTGNNTFSVYNSGEEAVNVYMSLVASDSEEGATTGTMDDPEEITVGKQSATLEAGSNGYFYIWTATEAGTATVTMDDTNENGWQYCVNNITSYAYGDTHWHDDDPVVSSQDITVSAGDEIQIMVNTYDPENQWNAPAGTVNWTLSFVAEGQAGDDTEGDVPAGDDTEGDTPAGDGTEDNPYVITEFGKYTATTDYTNCYFVWTAKADGTLTLTISEEDAAAWKAVYVYTLNGEYMDREFQATTNVTEVTEGDEIIIAAYAGAGSVEFTVAFEEALEDDITPGDGNDDTDDEKPESNAYPEDGTYDALVAGNVTMDESVITSLFEFIPEAVGVYTITVEEGVKVEDWNTTFFPNNLTENATNVLVLECTSEGQSFLVGLTCVDEWIAEPTVTITMEELEKEEEVEWTVYENEVTPEKFETILEDLEYVDVEDSVVDKAVLGEDGFYHLNTVDGPILYIDLNDSIMSVIDAAGYGKVVEYVTEDGKVVAKINYSEAVLAYAECANADGLYPVTVDLITIYQNAGEYLGWYGEDGFLGFTEEDAWMFACYYVPSADDSGDDGNVEEPGDSGDNGNVEEPGDSGDDGNVEEPDNSGDDGNVEKPGDSNNEGNTGDSTVVVPLPTPSEDKEDVVLGNEELDEYIEQAIQDKKPLVIPTTSDKVTMSFDANELKDNDSIKLNVTVNVVEDVKDEAVAKNDKITENNFVLKIEFAHDGKLPAKATIKILVGTDYADETLYYYQIMNDGKLKYICEATVDANGNIELTQDHCSDYVLLTEKVVPDTSDASNIALWFAVLGLGLVAIAGSVVMKKREF